MARKIDMITDYDPKKCKDCDRFVNYKDDKGKIVPVCTLFQIALKKSKFPIAINAKQKEICKQEYLKC